MEYAIYHIVTDYQAIIRVHSSTYICIYSHLSVALFDKVKEILK